jgi:hypothetical protein
MTMTHSAPAAVSAPPIPRRTGPSLPTLIGIEMRKSLSTRSGKALAVAAVLLGPAAVAIIAGASAEPPRSVTGSIGVTGLLTGYLLIALGVLSSAGEWTHRTVQTTFLLVPRRGRVLAAKAAAVGTLGAVLGAVSTSLSSGVLAVMVDGISWDGAGRSIPVAVAAAAGFALVGAGVGAAFANTPAALTGVYLTLLGVIPLISGFKPDLAQKFDPANAVLNLADGQNITTSVIIAACWVVIPAAAGWFLTQRRAVQ